MNDNDSPDLRELYGEFISENREILEKLSQELVSLENNPDDRELVNGIFRSAHTLKGNAGFLGLAALSELAHKMENVLDKIRDEELAFFPEINDVFFQAIDASHLLLEDFISGRETERDITGLIKDIEALLSGPVKTSDEEQEREKSNPEGGGGKTAAGDKSSSMRVRTSRLDRMVNLVGELATDRSRLTQISNDLKNDKLAEVTSHINRISAQLQDEILSLRMVPVRELFNRFYRLVRDTSRTLGKEVRLVVEGEKTELDKSIIELLYDPLVHLVRNSIGHGLEGGDERERLGKDRIGAVTLNAYHEHNSIYIQVKDDGRGLNIADIRCKALELGLAGEDELAGMSDEEAARFIFSSGFSTAKEVDSVSGRGVGMDVVRANIERIGGDVAIDWEEGRGTTINVRVPLTMAIVQLFLVSVGRHIFGIPLPYVDETIMISEKNLEYMNGQTVYMLRHKAIPVLRLSDIFDLKGGQDEKVSGKMLNILILSHMGMKAGIIIDDFMGKFETVIKPLGAFIDRLPTPTTGISGASLLGTGDIVLVMDIPPLWNNL